MIFWMGKFGEGKKVRDVIDYLDYEELVKLRKDINSGGFHIIKLLNRKIKDIELTHKNFCSYCGNEINQNKVNNYTLIFGPYDFRKKSTFCGIDCMESFLKNLKSMHEVDEKPLTD